jgi:23S rRNA pseudouridine955/2504/2580 synthase/23S rRNA pseudouridine1911/1915/1917 synthase
MNIEILYEDSDLLIANKPAGMLVIPDRFDENQPSLNKKLEEKLHQKIWVVHRPGNKWSDMFCQNRSKS